jgi:hypothetical protein
MEKNRASYEAPNEYLCAQSRLILALEALIILFF